MYLFRSLPVKESLVISFVIVLLLFFGKSVIASDDFTTVPLKIGFVDVDRITLESPTIQKLIKTVDGEVKELQGKIDEKSFLYQQLQQELTQKESILSQEAKEKKRQDLEELRNEMEDLQLQIEKKIRRSQREVIAPAMDIIGKAIRQVARESHYDLILRGEVILHGSKRTDVTKLIIQKIEEIAQSNEKDN